MLASQYNMYVHLIYGYLNYLGLTNNLADKKALKIKIFEILWTNTNFFRIFFLFIADNHVGIAYKMVDSIAAIYNYLRENGLRSQVVLVAYNNFSEYYLATFTLLSTWSFQSN